MIWAVGSRARSRAVEGVLGDSSMVVSAKTYEQVALEDPDGQWELECGRLRQKPGMTAEHGFLMQELGFQLMRWLEPRAVPGLHECPPSANVVGLVLHPRCHRRS